MSLRAVSEQVLALLRARIEAEADGRRQRALPADAAAGAGRPARAGAGAHQPARQRHQVLPGRAPGPATRRARGRRTLRVEIADTGPGIEPRHLPRLFERFYRVDSGRSRDMGGTGLGLSIVKHLVEAMNGTIGVDSTPGRGSMFWFTLPDGLAKSKPGCAAAGAPRSTDSLRRRCSCSCRRCRCSARGRRGGCRVVVAAVVAPLEPSPSRSSRRRRLARDEAAQVFGPILDHSRAAPRAFDIAGRRPRVRIRRMSAAICCDQVSIQLELRRIPVREQRRDRLGVFSASLRR